MNSSGIKWMWNRLRARWLEHKGDFAGAIRAYDEMEQIRPLTPSDRVLRARLLLSISSVREAHEAFSRLREEFADSGNPNVQYLRHYCTYVLSGFPGMLSGQWAYEARQAKQIACRRSLRRLFPMTTPEEIHDRMRPRR